MSLMTYLDAEDVMYEYLSHTDFVAALTGGLYKGKLPVNAAEDRKEYCVVNSLGLPNRTIQEGIINVNLHVPNIPIKVNGRQDNTQPSKARMKQLTSLAVSELKEFNSNEYWFTYQQATELQGDNNDTITNIRIEFYSENL